MDHTQDALMGIGVMGGFSVLAVTALSIFAHMSSSSHVTPGGPWAITAFLQDHQVSVVE